VLKRSRGRVCDANHRNTASTSSRARGRQQQKDEGRSGRSSSSQTVRQGAGPQGDGLAVSTSPLLTPTHRNTRVPSCHDKSRMSQRERTQMPTLLQKNYI